MGKIIHLSNEGFYNKDKAKIFGSWDIIAKNTTFCWLALTTNILTTKNIKNVNCKRCLKMYNKKFTK